MYNIKEMIHHTIHETQHYKNYIGTKRRWTQMTNEISIKRTLQKVTSNEQGASEITR